MRIGEHNTATDTDCEIQEDGEPLCSPPVQDLAIERSIPHPSYNTPPFQHDIGLIRVATPINLKAGKEVQNKTNVFEENWMTN